jgi:hypothetical protein
MPVRQYALKQAGMDADFARFRTPEIFLYCENYLNPFAEGA